MKAFIEWNSKYELGIRIIDDQHKKLVETVNKLHEAMEHRGARQVMPEILDSLVDYTKIHFRTEEELMRKYGFEGYEDHRHEHDDFIEKVSDFVEKFQHHSTISLEVMDFLKNWLLHHILQTDKETVQFLKSQGVI
jgi:hemerythrin-like metal-binding protein